MTITLSPEIEQTLTEQARKQGTTLESLVLEALQEKYNLPAVALAPPSKIEPRDDWERLLFSLAIDCGVSLSNEALSSESLYD